jgi:hypothetical protein
MATDAQIAMKGLRMIQDAERQRAGTAKDKELFIKEIKKSDAFKNFEEWFENSYELEMLFKEKPNVYTAISIFNATMIWSYGISISQVRSAYKEADIDYKKLNTKIFKACDKIMKSHLGIKVKLDKESGKRQFNPF